MIALAIVGAAAGIISAAQKRYQQQQEIARQREYAKMAEGYKTQYNQGMWNLQKGEALENLGAAKNHLMEALGMDVEKFNLGLEGQALQTQDARIGLADSAGMALAAQGAGGTRGSGSLQMRLDYAENSLNRQIGLQEKGNALAMGDMVRQYSNKFDDIGRETASWGPGGYKYTANELGKTYAAQMYGLHDAGYKDAMADMNDPMNVIPDYLAAGLSGFASGAQYGAQFDKWREQAKGSGV